MVTTMGNIFMINTDPVNAETRLVTTSSVSNNDVSMAEKVLSIAPLPSKVAAISTTNPNSFANVSR